MVLGAIRSPSRGSKYGTSTGAYWYSFYQTVSVSLSLTSFGARVSMSCHGTHCSTKSPRVYTGHTNLGVALGQRLNSWIRAKNGF